MPVVWLFAFIGSNWLNNMVIIIQFRNYYLVYIKTIIKNHNWGSIGPPAWKLSNTFFIPLDGQMNTYMDKLNRIQTTIVDLQRGYPLHLFFLGRRGI